MPASPSLEDPRAPGCEKLSAAGLYRLRRGAYRIIYETHDEWRMAEVNHVGRRGEAWRRD